MSVRWAVTPEKIEAVVKRLVEVARPSRIILFGSAARGDLHEHSDVDLMVVLPEPPRPNYGEAVSRMYSALADIPIAKDLIVVTEERLAELGNRPSLIYREALREGRVIYEAPTVSPGREAGKKRRPCNAGLPLWWLEHARRDLALARLAYESDLDFAEQVCFHAQQAAEKAIKAALLDRNVDFSYKPDLEKLVGEMTKRGMTVPPDIAQASALTRYAVKTRYPNTEHEIIDDHVVDAMVIAEATVAWAAGLVRDN